MIDPTAQSYDDVPYDSKPFGQSHPDRLAAIGTLLGLRPAPIERCRVLELGCAAGGNIVPMACALPESRFMGVELSARQVADGVEFVRAMGARNVELRHLSILDITPELGEFDYIIAHGVFSWVPREVQEALFRVCRENLAPQGIAYISYNTFPGWRLRGVVRDVMLYHTRQFDEPKMRIAQARAMLEFMAQSVGPGGPYGTILHGELKALRQQPDYFVYHEHLENANDPIYFHEFAERLSRHGLAYLADTEFSVTYPGNFPPEIVQTLARVTDDHVRIEQYLDFLLNRSFRHSLVCRREAPVDRRLSASRLASLHVAATSSKAAAGAGTPDDDLVCELRFPNGVAFSTASRVVKTAFAILESVWPQSLPTQELHARSLARVRAGGAEDAAGADALLGVLLECYCKGAVHLRSRAVDFALAPGDRPMASALVRYLATRGNLVTNQLHELVQLDEAARRVLPLLDGTRTVEQVTAQTGVAAARYVDLFARRAFLVG